MKDELRDLLNNIVSKESYGRVEDEDIDQAVDAILELFNKQLPSEHACNETCNILYKEWRIGHRAYKDAEHNILGEIRRAAGLEEK